VGTYYAELASVLQERLEVISDQDLRMRTPEIQLQKLSALSQRIDQLKQRLPADADPMLKHFLERMSLSKALELIRSQNLAATNQVVRAAMRIAVLADIHANLLALEAVIADLETVQPDQVIVAGDFQNRGPAPREVYDRLRKLEWPLLRGNHEDYVIEQSKSPPEEAHLVDLYAWQPARWTAERVPETIPFLRTLPISIDLTGPDGSFICIAHGSPRSNAEGFFPSTGEAKAFAML
jgi:hypothetical protein